MEQTIFGAGSHHAVRLIGAFGYQIVNQRTDIPVGPAENHRLPTQQFQRRIHTGHKALHGGLFISGRAVKLTGAVQTGDFFRFQGGIQLRGVHAVVLNGIGAAGHFRVGQTGNGVHHFHLHVFRQRGRKSLNIQLPGIQTHGLHKQLMPGLIREGHDFRLDGGAVPGADALNDPGINGAAVQIFPNDFVGALIGVGQPANCLIIGHLLAFKGKGLDVLIARLNFHFVKIHRPGIDPRGRTGFEPAHTQPHGRAALGQRTGGSQTVRAGIPEHVAHNGPAVEIGARGDDGGPAVIHRAGMGDNAGDGAVFREDFHHFRLLDPEILLILQGPLHHFLIFPPVCLRPERIHRGTLAPIQHTVLNAGFIGGFGHFSAQSVQLPDQMALARAADGGVAGHIAHSVHIDGKTNGVQTQSGGGQSGLNAGMTGADDGHIADTCVVLLHNFHLKGLNLSLGTVESQHFIL